MKGRIPGLAFNIILFFLHSLCSAQGVWEVQNPLPVSEPLLDAFCLPNTTKAWAVGNYGTILKTVDGNRWSILYSGTSATLLSVQFYDSNTGWAAGNEGTIIKTTNGGSTWIAQISGTTLNLNSIHFVNSTTGWAVGDDGTIIKTTNGGSTWSPQISGTAYDLRSVFFVTTSIGYISGNSATLLKTTDGGSNWIALSPGTSVGLLTLYFVSSTVGWVAGMGHTILHTTDGGTTWTPQTNGVPVSLFDAYGSYFYNSNTGWIVGWGYILRTTDGGATWTVQSNITSDSRRSVCFSNLTTGWVVGNNILKTNDGGNSWIPLSSGVTKTLNSVKFKNVNKGWAVGITGTILNTVDAGLTWVAQTSPATSELKDIYFYDENIGWAVGFDGTIIKTTNGGSTWVAQTSGTAYNLYSVYFINSTTGWTVGSNGTILKTINGGSTWIDQSAGASYSLVYVRFFDVNNGMAITGYGSTSTLLKTTDGGSTWNTQTLSFVTSGAFFINSTTGWAYYTSANSYIKKTIDGGTTWTNQLNYPQQIFNLFFYNSNIGWAVGRETILKTTDGGTTWISESCNTSRVLNGAYFVEPNTGWTVGTQGIILHYTNFSPTTQAGNLVSSNPTYQSINVSWTRGNGNQNALFVKQANTGNCVPDVNVTYLPNSTFGLGDQVGSTGWYCVYNGSGTSVTVSGLEPSTAYRYQVCEYNFSPDFTHYNSTTATNNPITVTTAIAPPQITINPADITLCENLNTAFSVTASGSGLNYQWRVDAGSGYLNVTNSGVYSGSTTPTLSITGIPASLNSYKYHCVVTNTSGNATSNEAVLTVNPLPVNPADVSGNQVVCLNSSYLYTVPPVQYSTSYSWTYPAGFSGNSTINNITLATASNAISGNITVKGINACGSGPVKNFTVNVRKLPGSASQITGLNNVCTGSINTGYNTAIIGDADYYVWSLPFEATGSSTTNSIMVNYGSNPLAGQITVKGHNICGDGPQSILPVSVNTVPAAIGTIAGRSNVCKNEKNLLYAINPIPNASSYLWTLPAGITGSNSTNSVSLSIGPEAFSGDLKVSGVNSCGVGTPIVFPVIVDAVPDKPGPITGPSTVCRGTSNIQYSVTKSERATSYTWELPDGTSETTLVSKIALNFNNNAVSGYLSVSPNNSCGSGNSSTAFIEVSVPSKPEIDPGNYKGGTCTADTPVRLSVKQPIAGYSYLWYKNAKLYNNSNSTFLSDFLSNGDYSVEANLNGCKVQSEVFNIYYPDAPAKPSIYIHGPNVWYLACSNDKARDYKWYYNGDIIQGADKYIHVANKKLGNYYVTISNDAGCYTSSDVVKIPVDGMSIEDTDPFSGLTIYPNPNSGQFTIETYNRIFGEVEISVLDQRGNEIFRSKSEKTSEKFSSLINLRNKSKGIYFVNLRIKGLITSSKIIIE